jgi:hypothetical protein
MHVSVLAIASSEEPRSGKSVSEYDLKRSSVLCGVADSVSAVGRGRASERYIIQTRSRNTEIKWNVHNAPVAQIKRMENGWPGFVFDRRFARTVDPEQREMICRIRAMRQAGSTWRSIAAELGIATSRATRLFQKWTPEMGGEEFASEYARHRADSPPTEPVGTTDPQPAEPEEWEIIGGEKPVWFDLEGPKPETPSSDVPQRDPLRMYGPERVSVYDLKRGINGYGREIFIQEMEEPTGRPKIWYEFDRQGIKVRSMRSSAAITVTRLGPTEYL